MRSLCGAKPRTLSPENSSGQMSTNDTWVPGTMPQVKNPRTQGQSYLSREQGEGAGARVRRSIGRPELRNVDPFLMLDEFKVGLPAGFPDHPHRGFETVTYMLPDSPGPMTHEDSAGNAGTLRAGDLQWMTAARGILHSEVPGDKKPAHGLQMWINLAAKDKMGPPEYQEIPREQVLKVEADSVRAIVVAGESLGMRSPVRTRTPCVFVHGIMPPGATFHQPIPSEFTAFVYTLEGSASFSPGKPAVDAHNTVTFSSGAGEDGLLISTGQSSGASFVIVAARPIGESIVQHGPFVMNTQQEIRQAMMDFQRGTNGFEGSMKWNSKNSRLMGR